MGSKRFYSQNVSLFIVKLKKLGFSAPLTELLLPLSGFDFDDHRKTKDFSFSTCNIIEKHNYFEQNF